MIRRDPTPPLFAPLKHAGIRDVLAVPPAPPIAATTDPATSHEAAARVTDSGQRQAGIDRVVAGVQAHPGRTSRELAELIGMDRHECARRLSDARHAGLVVQGETRVCGVGGTRAVTWRACP